jgi:hypothetical protein
MTAAITQTREELCELLTGVPFPMANPGAELPVEPAAYFASGCQTGEVTGFAEIGHDVGVVAGRINAQVERELLSLEGSDVQVFVDSGAFSEVKWNGAGFDVVKPITDADWQKILATYKRLAQTLGDQLHVVAPDQVGSQDVTLCRLASYAADLRELDELGARVLVPVQKGEMTQADFYRAACELVGIQMMPALPCKKAATSVAEARLFAEVIQPASIHLLGLGVKNRKAAAYLSAIEAASPDAMIQMDSCIIAAASGKTGGPGKGPRRLTRAAAIINQLVGLGRLAADTFTRKRAGIHLAFGGAA